MRSDQVVFFKKRARYLASRYCAFAGDFEELEQVALTGAVLAMRNFDKTKGVLELSYAKWKMLSEVQRFCARERAQEHTCSQLAFLPGKKKRAKYGNTAKASQLRLDAVVPGCDTLTFGETIGLEPTQERHASARLTLARVLRRLEAECADEVDRDIIEGRIATDDPLPLRVLSAKHRVSHETIRNRERRLMEAAEQERASDC